MLATENQLLKNQIAFLTREVKSKPFAVIPLIILSSALLLINNAQEIAFRFISHK